jgi:hypothetical protein
MALETGGCHQVYGMAVITGGALVVDAAAIAATAGVGQVELGGRPGGGIVAQITGHVGEQAKVESWLSMAGDTVSRQAFKNTTRMTLAT